MDRLRRPIRSLPDSITPPSAPSTRTCANWDAPSTSRPMTPRPWRPSICSRGARESFPPWSLRTRSAYAVKLAKELGKDGLMIVNLSGRGDKDVDTVAKLKAN